MGQVRGRDGRHRRAEPQSPGGRAFRTRADAAGARDAPGGTAGEMLGVRALGFPGFRAAMRRTGRSRVGLARGGRPARRSRSGRRNVSLRGVLS